MNQVRAVTNKFVLLQLDGSHRVIFTLDDYITLAQPFFQDENEVPSLPHLPLDGVETNVDQELELARQVHLISAQSHRCSNPLKSHLTQTFKYWDYCLL